jgi:hypothetical protein
MKYEGELVGSEWVERDARTDVNFEVLVRGPSRDVGAELINLSSDGFRLRCDEPLTVGSEVTLEVAKHDPLRAVICWACGLDAGGVFAEPVAL